MHHSHLDQGVQVVAGKVPFKRFEMIEQLKRRRRHERRLIDRAALGAEPVLVGPELARRLVRALSSLSMSTRCMLRISDSGQGPIGQGLLSPDSKPCDN